ncbi:MAG: hypothetical protein AVDCRST_MAG60-1226, partial [uncultured Nocardioides sp.]
DSAAPGVPASLRAGVDAAPGVRPVRAPRRGPLAAPSSRPRRPL